MPAPTRAPVLWPFFSFYTHRRTEQPHDDDNSTVISATPAPPLASLRKRPPLAKKDIHKDFHLVLCASFFLCFNAAFINVITLNGYFGLATSHVTGLVAKTSMALGKGDWGTVYLPATAWLAFLGGSFLAGVLISYESFYLGRGYGRALLMISCFLSIALIIDEFTAERHQYVYMCALACGLQNGLTTKYSGNVVRTTHMTGATTDLGVVLGHVARGKWEELWKIKLHMTAILGYLAGGILAQRSFLRYAEFSLIFTVFVTASLGIAHIAYVSHHEEMRPWDVARSRRDIKITYRHPHASVRAMLEKQDSIRSNDRQPSIRVPSVRNFNDTLAQESVRSSERQPSVRVPSVRNFVDPLPNSPLRDEVGRHTHFASAFASDPVSYVSGTHEPMGAVEEGDEEEEYDRAMQPDKGDDELSESDVALETQREFEHAQTIARELQLQAPGSPVSDVYEGDGV